MTDDTRTEDVETPESDAASVDGSSESSDSAKQPLGELDEHITELGTDHAPDVAVAESLREALKTLRADADAIEQLKTGEQQVEAAEALAEAAGELDEQLGSIARADGEHD